MPFHKIALWFLLDTEEIPPTDIPAVVVLTEATLFTGGAMPVTTIATPHNIPIERGNVARIPCKLLQFGAELAADPSTVVLTVHNPAGTSTSYTLAGAQVIKSEVGSYYYDLTVSQTGIWPYTWTTTGPVSVGSGYVVVIDPAVG